MFTWICPQCGREVPPAYNECPDCAAREQQKQAPPGEPAAPPPEVQPAAPPPPPPRPPAAVRRRGPGIPTWLMSILFAGVFIGLGVGVYWGVNYYRQRGEAKQPAIALQNAGAEKGKVHPLQRYIEVTGVRFLQDAKRRTEVRFVLVNHSPDIINDLGGTVTIWGRTQKSDEEAVGSFAFKLPSIGAWESKEMTSLVNTTLRAYELPDWQNVTAEVQLSSP